jgi:hypothetical protein
MKQKAGTFSAQRLEKGIAYTWAELETDIVKQYRPTSQARLGQTQALVTQTGQYALLRLCRPIHKVLQRRRDRPFPCHRYP